MHTIHNITYYAEILRNGKRTCKNPKYRNENRRSITHNACYISLDKIRQFRNCCDSVAKRHRLMIVESRLAAFYVANGESTRKLVKILKNWANLAIFYSVGLPSTSIRLLQITFYVFPGWSGQTVSLSITSTGGIVGLLHNYRLPITTIESGNALKKIIC